ARGVGVHRSLFLGFNLQDVPQLRTDVAPEADGALAQPYLRWRRQAQGLEELLYRPQSERGQPLHGISPAIVAVPLGYRPLLEKRCRFLGGGFRFFRNLARAQRTGQDTFRERLDGYLGPHNNHTRATIGFDQQPAFERLAARPELPAADVNRQRALRADLEQLRGCASLANR